MNLSRRFSINAARRRRAREAKDRSDAFGVAGGRAESRQRAAKLFCALLLASIAEAPVAQPNVFRCVDAKGRVTYTQTGCEATAEEQRGLGSSARRLPADAERKAVPPPSTAPGPERPAPPAPPVQSGSSPANPPRTDAPASAEPAGNPRAPVPPARGSAQARTEYESPDTPAGRAASREAAAEDRRDRALPPADPTGRTVPTRDRSPLLPNWLYDATRFGRSDARDAGKEPGK